MAGEKQDVLSASRGARAWRREPVNQQSQPQTICSERNENNCGLSNACHFNFPSREWNAESGIQLSEIACCAGGIRTQHPVLASVQVPSVEHVIEKTSIKSNAFLCYFRLKNVIINEMSNYFKKNKTS